MTAGRTSDGATRSRRLGLVLVLAAFALVAACHRLVIVDSPTLVDVGVMITRPFIGSDIELFDGEGMAYVSTDGTLWLADDNGDRLYEVQAATGVLLSTIDASTLATVLEFGGGPAAGSDRSGDLEAVAYDEASDVLYAVSNGCCTPTSQPTIFRLTRRGSSFVPESWQALSREMTGAAATPAGELYLSSGSLIYPYDYVTDTLGAGFSITDLAGMIHGLSFSDDGYDLWVGTGLTLYRVDWDSKTVVPGYEFDDHGLGETLVVEAIGSLIYVLDGDDTLEATDPMKHAIHVYRIDAAPRSPVDPLAAVNAAPAVGLAPLTVELDAGASFDPDGTIDVYHWYVLGTVAVTQTFVPSHQVEFTTPGAYTVSVTVEDDGGNLKVASVPVVVKEANIAPVLNSVGDQRVVEGIELAFTATAADTNVPVDNTTFSLAGARPAGASISAGGEFTWTPSEAQGPGVFTFDVVVTDDGIPNREDRETITVTVADVNRPPVLDPIGDQTVDEGVELAFTVVASDLDLPVNMVAFSLEGEIPAGASISDGGEFTWTPNEAQGPGTHLVKIEVSDGGRPALRDTVAFEVHVLEVS